jgi:hypothetical protein
LQGRGNLFSGLRFDASTGQIRQPAAVGWTAFREELYAAVQKSKGSHHSSEDTAEKIVVRSQSEKITKKL